ncbi:hypothetical protein [Cohnella sp. WQ 127256]|uniref:hypothetical protein n=1 Tax=Cohnella sp. WQ 127256 TaxID=2938790 RepID=UPI0021193CC6|nr:hypothetical protein [Cohnella sp. WQ 127256]
MHVSENEREHETYEAFETYTDEEWDDEEVQSEIPAPRRKWIRNTIVSLLVAALIGYIGVLAANLQHEDATLLVQIEGAI